MGSRLALLLVFLTIPVGARAQDEETRTTKGLYPLFYHRQEGPRSELGFLGPLIQFQSEPGRSYSALLPFYAYEEDEVADLEEMSFLYLIWPLVKWKRQREEESFRIFPLVWHSQDPVGGSTVVLPLYWSFWDDEHDREGLRKRWFRMGFPLYWDIGRDPGYRYFHLWPLYGHHSRKDHYDSYSFAWPFFRYGHDRKSDEVEVDFPWPIVTYRKSPDAYTFRIFPLFHFSGDPRESWNMVTPLLGHVRTERSTTSWVFPLYHRHATEKYSLQAFALNLLVLQSSRKSKEISLLWPFTKFRIDGEEKSIRIAPLIWGEATPSEHWFLFFPLAYSRATHSSSDLLIFPLLYHGRRGVGEGERGTTVLFPLIWDFRGRDSRFSLLFPFHLGQRDGEDHFRYYFPSVVDIRSGENRYFHAWPFYGIHRRGETYRRHFFLAPFFSYASDDEKNEWQLDLLWPIFSYRSGPEMESLRFLPFVWYERRPKGSTDFVFPLWWRSEDEDSSYFYTLFYGYQRERDTFRREIYAMGAYVHTEDKERDLDRHDVLFPLYTRKREGEATTTALRPLFWHTSWPQGSSTLLLPLFYRKVDPDGSLFLSLLYNSGEDRKKDTDWDNVLGFIYNRSREGETTRTDVLFPFVHSESGPDSETLDIRPLYWHSRRKNEGHTLLLPFYIHTWGKDEDALHVIPFYSHIEKKDGSTVTAILGPTYVREESERELSEHFLWPIGHHYRGVGIEKWQVRPLFWHENLAGREKRTVLFPIYWRHTSPTASHLIIWPIFGTSEWQEGIRKYHQISGIVHPFFSYTWDEAGDYSRLDLLFPIFRNKVDRFDAETWLFPLFFYDRETIGKTDDTDLYILPPLFHHHSRGEETEWSVLWKLLTYESTEEHRDFRFLFELIRSRRHRDHSLFRLFPLISWEKEPGGEDAPFHFSFLWPLIDYSTSPQETEFSFLWEVFNYHTEPDLVRVRFLHILFQYEETDTDFLLELNPIFSVETTPDSSYFSILGGLFSVDSRKEETDIGLFWFF